MDKIPVELVQNILQYADPVICKFVCKAWRNERRAREQWICQYVATDNMRVIKWAYKNGCPMGKVQAAAAKYNKLKTIRWVHGKVSTRPAFLTATFAKHGNLQALQWLSTHGYLWTDTACSMAVSNGHLDVLKWVVRSNMSYDKDMCMLMAKQNGHKHIESWLDGDTMSMPYKILTTVDRLVIAVLAIL